MKNNRWGCLFVLAAMVSLSRAQTPIACDGDVSGSIGTPAEVDQYSFSAAAGDIVIIRMQYDGALIDPKIQLSGPGINQTTTGPGTDPAVLGPVQLQGGNYIISASDEGANNTGSYGLSLQVLKASCSVPLGCSEDVNANLSKKAEIDAYTFDVTTAGTRLVARMQQDGNTLYSHLELYKTGSTSALDENTGTTSIAARIDAGNLSPGTYILLAMDAGGNYSGAYGLSLQFVNASCAVSIGCSEDVGATLSKKAEMDAYTFEVITAGARLVARMQQDGNTLYSHLELFKVGSDNLIMDNTGNTSTAAYMNINNLSPGTYVLLAMDAGGNYSGAYGISLQFIDAACAVPINCSDDVSATLAKKAEMDAYTFQVTTSGTRLIARMQQDGVTMYSRLELYKVGAAGQVNESMGNTSTAARIDAYDLLPGTYVLLAMDDGGTYAGAYGLSLQFIDASCATPVSCTEDVSTSLAKKAEMDAYTFDVTTSGTRVVARMQQDGFTLYSRLELYKVGSGGLIEEGVGNTSTAARIDVSNLSPGTYVLLAMDNGGNYAGAYGLSLQFIDASCATPIGCTEDVGASLVKKAEMDAYTFTVMNSGTYVVARMQQNGATLYSRLELYKVGSSGIVSEGTGSSSTAARIDAPNLNAGTYVLLAMDNGGNYAGAYGLSLQLIDPSCATPLTCAGDVSGTLDHKSEMDAYTFDIATTGVYLIARMQQAGNTLNSHLELYKTGANSPFTEGDGNSSAAARIDAPTLSPGTYVLLVMDKTGSYAGDYNLSVQLIDPACAQGLDSCHNSLIGNLGKKAEMEAYTFQVASPATHFIARMQQNGSNLVARIELYKLGVANALDSDDGQYADPARIDKILTPGTYVLVCMDNYGNYTGDFSLATQVVRPNCTTPLACNGGTGGILSNQSEMDAYHFDIVPGDNYILQFHGKTISGDWRLEFYNQNGQPLPTLSYVQVGSSESSRLELSPATLAGVSQLICLVTYYGPYPDDYDLSFQGLNPACAQAVACGEDIAGNTTLTTEMDLLALPVAPGDRLLLRFRENVSGAELRLEFYHADGTSWFPTLESDGSLQDLYFTFTQTDTLLLLATDSGADELVSAYGLSFQMLRPDCAAQLDCQHVDYVGTLIKQVQTDAYHFEVIPGARYMIRAKGANSNFDAVMRIYSPSGALFATLNETNNLTEFSQILDTAGTWYLLLNEKDGDASGVYYLSFIEVGATACAGNLSCGQSLQGNLAQNTSWKQFRVSASAGQKLVARGQAQSGFTPRLDLFRANGFLASSSQNGRIDYAIDASGDFYLLISDNAAAGTGTFHLAMQWADDSGCGPTVSYNQNLLAAHASPAEIDGYTFSAIAGDVLVFQSGACSATFDARAELYNAAGQLVVSDFTDNGLARLDTVHVPATGLYRLLVMEKEGDETGDYGLSLQKVDPAVGALTLSPGVAAPGALSQAAEMEVYTLTGYQGASVSLTMTVLSGNIQPRMEVYDPQGKRIASGSYGGSTATLTINSLPLNGIYTVLVMAANQCGAGNFELKWLATLSASPLSIGFTGAGGQSLVTVSGNCTDWTFSGVPAWISVSPLSGNGTEIVTIACNPNPGNSSRSANITLSGCGLTQTITVTQAGATLTCQPLTLNVGASAGQASFSVLGNCADWSASENVSWLFFDGPSNGSGPGTVTINFFENLAPTVRSTTITLSGCGQTITITVTQAGASPVLSAEPAFLEVGAAGGTETFAVSGNCTDWILSENTSWLTLSQTSGSAPAVITVTLSPNPSIYPRTAIITLSGCGINQTITVVQAGVFIEVIPTALDLGSAAGADGILVEGNCPDWMISGMPGWLSASPVNGNGQQIINLLFSANPDPAPRLAVLSVSGCGALFTVTVVQDGAGGVTITGDAEICQGQSAILEAPSGYDSYQWSNGSTGQVISVETPGLYSVTVHEGINVLYGSFSVTVHPSPGQALIGQTDPFTLTASATGASGWQWFFNSTPIPGATGQNYQPQAEGDYTVQAISAFGCEGPVSAAYTFMFVGLAELPDCLDIEVAPNPASEGFSILVRGECSGTIRFSLIDGLGRQCRTAVLDGSRKELWIDCDGLPAGAYFLLVQTDAGRTGSKKVWLAGQ